jgi:hypothetical protein
MSLEDLDTVGRRVQNNLICACLFVRTMRIERTLVFAHWSALIPGESAGLAAAQDTRGPGGDSGGECPAGRNQEV